MKYMILINHNEQTRDAWQNMSEAEQAVGMKAHMSLVGDLSESGELIVSDALADQSQAKRVLVKDGQVSTTDGPFPEVKEYVAGFYLIECDSLEKAVEHAARIPEANFGMVEVRPVLSAGGPDM
ncbi:YciI family protein [Micromonospora echinofusca]|uniref:YciI family protein n=1 Tax=Micromonospora echinofusca TaxID=47858 RepID=UPI00202284B6|nr:YciI family protein [Micromonospora sp. MSM11]MCL7459613.1 YciI family protein [Micromonospora sp. MSM11]